MVVVEHHGRIDVRLDIERGLGALPRIHEMDRLEAATIARSIRTKHEGAWRRAEADREARDRLAREEQDRLDRERERAKEERRQQELRSWQAEQIDRLQAARVREEERQKQEALDWVKRHRVSTGVAYAQLQLLREDGLDLRDRLAIAQRVREELERRLIGKESERQVEGLIEEILDDELGGAEVETDDFDEEDEEFEGEDNPDVDEDDPEEDDEFDDDADEIDDAADDNELDLDEDDEGDDCEDEEW